MPREIARKPRFIYPTIATSLSIAQVSALAELLFWRILPQADDQGRLSGHPKQLKALACPMREEITEKNIPELLKELEGADLIIQYTASSEPLIQIKTWWVYQAGMRRIYPSRQSAPKGWEDRVKGISGGQEPTNAPDVPPISVDQVISRSGNQVIRKPEAVVVPPTTAEKELFDLWNSLGVIKHKKLTGDMTRAIKATSRDFSVAEISQAMKNYAHIVNDEQCFFKFRWTMEDFLKRGLRKFLDLEVALNNYRRGGADERKDSGQGKGGEIVGKQSRQERARPLTYIRGSEEVPRKD